MTTTTTTTMTTTLLKQRPRHHHQQQQQQQQHRPQCECSDDEILLINDNLSTTTGTDSKSAYNKRSSSGKPTKKKTWYRCWVATTTTAAAAAAAAAATGCLVFLLWDAPFYTTYDHMTSTIEGGGHHQRRQMKAHDQQQRGKQSSLASPLPILYGTSLPYALYRFNATKLGPNFLKAIDVFDEWIGPDGPNPTAAQFALEQTQQAGPHHFHHDCYQPPDEELYLTYENLKKNVLPEHYYRNVLVAEHDFFFGYGKDRIFDDPHKEEEEEAAKERENEQNAPTTEKKKEATKGYISDDGKWAWRSAGVFSGQYSDRQHEFRSKVRPLVANMTREAATLAIQRRRQRRRQMQQQQQQQEEEQNKGIRASSRSSSSTTATTSITNVLNDDDKEEELAMAKAVVSGEFWYPPGGIREWHTNVFDCSLEKPWRMYYIRTKRTDGLPLDPHTDKDLSGMHLVEGPGMPPERLAAMGGYRVEKNDGNNNDGKVWRLPDQDGYVSMFRLQCEPPYRWHCIVSGPDAHRYSLGMKLSDAAIEAILEFAQVPFS